MHKPYKKKSTNLAYDLLFCDDIGLFRGNQKSGKYPWGTVLSENPGKSDLEKILDDDTIESRVKALAYNRLLSRGETTHKKELLGIIIEIGLEKGLDVLAAYRDGTARYIDQSGKSVFWDTKDDRSDSLIMQLFMHGENVINNIAPWDKTRLPHPVQGMARITFLVSDGLYFGQGPIGVLFNDKMGKPVLQSGTELVKYLTGRAS